MSQYQVKKRQRPQLDSISMYAAPQHRPTGGCSSGRKKKVGVGGDSIYFLPGCFPPTPSANPSRGTRKEEASIPLANQNLIHFPITPTEHHQYPPSPRHSRCWFSWSNRLVQPERPKGPEGKQASPGATSDLAHRALTPSKALLCIQAVSLNAPRTTQKRFSRPWMRDPLPHSPAEGFCCSESLAEAAPKGRTPSQASPISSNATHHQQDPLRPPLSTLLLSAPLTLHQSHRQDLTTSL